MLNDLYLNAIEDEIVRQLIWRLQILIDQLPADLREALAENQHLRDEVNRLKGEQCKPKIKANTAKAVSTDQSIHDCISGANQIMPMGILVKIATIELILGWSFKLA